MIYTTKAVANAGRDGNTALTDSSLTLPLSTPGSSIPGHNPEQLFAMGYAACFDSALKLSARQLKLPLTGSETAVTVGLENIADEYRLSVDIEAQVSGLRNEQAQRLVETAHEVCPYSKALRGDATVNVQSMQ